ncbi:MAG: RNA methyltransferase [Robiginitomaculum sp.]|nr:RNA methyltransferase [Robiginitomaculum sp.]
MSKEITKEQLLQPVIILSQPQMGENIGATARVMRNFGLLELRIISPRDGWPNEKSTAMAAGAFNLMKPVRVFEDVATAIADLQQVFAVTARRRDMEKPVLFPDKAMEKIHLTSNTGARSGLLFGAEASGLSNTEVGACDGILTYPVASDFGSLNLAQAVAVAAFAWRNSIDTQISDESENLAIGNALATKQELAGMLKHLEGELVSAGFFHPPEKAPVMMQNLQNLFSRAEPTAQEVRTLRGVIKALSAGRGKRNDNR